MANGDVFTRCDLERGATRITAWIPTRGAKIGTSIEVVPETLCKANEIWTVTAVHPGVKDSASLRETINKQPGATPIIWAVLFR